jgi:crotonobetaine/carnitine-CoA ligase
MASAPQTLGDVLERAAEIDKFVLTCDGRKTRASELLAMSDSVAGTLVSLGVQKGDRVAIMMRNSAEFLGTWFGLARAGIIEVALHTESRGDVLRHVIDESGARVLICDGEFLGRLKDLQLPALEHVIVRGEADEPPRRTHMRSFDEAAAHGSGTSFPAVTPDDISTICYTSGTTGPSKGAVLGHRANLHLAKTVVDLMEYDESDVLYTVFPLSHINAKFTSTVPALLTGAELVLEDRFSATRFWDTMRAHGVTEFNYMGSLLAMLAKQPERENDRDHSVRRSYGAGCSAELWPIIEGRFGIMLIEHYGMSETGITTRNTAVERRVGSCGKAAPYYDVRIAGEDGFEVPIGEIGEIQVRPRLPGILFQEYWERPDATIPAFRDLWFRTGDRARMDADGFFYFVDRAKDCIRRRGENISSWEIEATVNTHPAVMESAAYGVPDEISEEEVMLAVVLQPRRQADPRELIDYCTARLPRYAIPRYIAFVDELPKNQNQRIQKFKLRQAGIELAVYDRVGAIRSG